MLLGQLDISPFMSAHLSYALQSMFLTTFVPKMVRGNGQILIPNCQIEQAPRSGLKVGGGGLKSSGLRNNGGLRACPRISFKPRPQ